MPAITFAPQYFLVMKKFTLLSLVVVAIFVVSAFDTTKFTPQQLAVTKADTIQFPGETHFANVRQLTFGGDNAEAYFSFDGKYIVFQKTNPKEGINCDQIWMGKLPTTAGEKFEPRLVSTGTGRTTCAYFFPDGKHILYASTHLANK